MSGYSVNLRERVIKASEGGKTQAWTAATFSLSVSSIKRYISRYKATSRVAPINQGREQPLIKPSDEAAVRAMVERKSDAKLEWYCQDWEQTTGVNCSSFFSWIWKVIAYLREGITLYRLPRNCPENLHNCISKVIDEFSPLVVITCILLFYRSNNPMNSKRT